MSWPVAVKIAASMFATLMFHPTVPAWMPKAVPRSALTASSSGVTLRTSSTTRRRNRHSAITRVPRPAMNDWKLTFLSPLSPLSMK